MASGRNKPCPCGSGKKYKKCCMQNGMDPATYMKQKLDQYHERAVGDLQRHMRTVFGPEAFDEALDEFFCWPEEEDMEAIDIEAHATLFYPWFLFKWRIESADGESTLSGPLDLSIARSYVQSRGARLDAVEREYLERFTDAPFTFFEVIAVQPGKSVSLRDLLLESDHLVLENTASQIVKKGDVLFGSVFEAGGISLFGALSMIAFSPGTKVEILDLKQIMSHAAPGRISAEILEEYDMELRELYFDLYQGATTMPSFCNSDGDELAFHTLEYTITSPQQVFDALKELSHGFADDEELLQTAEYDPNGALRKVEIPWLLSANKKHAGRENTVYGHLIIDGSTMACEVNSAERAERLRAIIEERLPNGEAVYKTTLVQSKDAMMQAPRSSDDAEHEKLMENPEVKAMIEQMMQRHWESWVDMELPALQGKTPRQAVQDELGRQQVNALLEDAEKRYRESGDTFLGRMEHLQWVRRTLGLDKLQSSQ